MTWRGAIEPRLIFRSDLNISQQEASGKTVYIIKDPVSGKYFRLKEIEYFIATLFDGTNDLDDVAAKFADKFGIIISIPQLEQFSQALQAKGLLADVDTSAKTFTPENSKKSLFSKLLFIKLKAVNPERFVESTFRLSKPFYSSPALKIYLLLVIIAVGITIGNFSDMKYQLSHFFTPGTIALAWITIFFVTVLHELSHTYSCRLNGGKVRDMGFLFLYFQPCFYSNVSDAYLFPDKRKRIAVTLAGIVSQIMVWALATIIWRLTSMDNIINTVAFIIIALSFVGITFNLNPLLKLDAYYFLVDYWEIPNLRRKAFQYLRQRLLGNPPDEPPLEASDREKRIFTWYGLASLVYSGSLISYIAYKIGRFLNNRFGSFGVALLVIVLLYLIFDAMKKGRIFQLAYSQRGAILRPGRLMITGAVIAAIVVASIFIHLPLRIANDCQVTPLERVQLTTVTPGAAELLVERANEEKTLKQYQLIGQDYSVLSIVPALKSGDRVHAGDLIASIKSNVYESEKLERYANLERAKKQLDLLEKGPQQEEIKQTEDVLAQVKSKFTKSLQDLNRAESLYAKGGISQNDLEDTRTSNQVLKSELDFYKNQLTLLKRGARPEELDMAKAEVDQLEAKMKHLESQLAQTIIESPIDGIVTQVNSGSTVISIARTDTVKVKISVPEKEIAAVGIGDRIRMKVRAYPGLTYEGHVLKIEPLAVVDSRDRAIITVTAAVANRGGLLKSGMTGKAKINCGNWPLYKLVLWRVVRYLRIEFWSWW